MLSGDRGRLPERSGQRYLTTREASEVLGVTRATVINWIRSGDLEGEDYHTQAGERRWEATKESVARKAKELEELGRLVAKQDPEEQRQLAVEEIISTLESIFERIFGENSEHILSSLNVELLENRKTMNENVVRLLESQSELSQAQTTAIDEQRADIVSRLDTMAKSTEEAARVAKEMAQEEKKYQERALDLAERAVGREDRIEKLLQNFVEVMERTEAREKERLEEERKDKGYRLGARAILWLLIVIVCLIGVLNLVDLFFFSA